MNKEKCPECGKNTLELKHGFTEAVLDDRYGQPYSRLYECSNCYYSFKI